MHGDRDVVPCRLEHALPEARFRREADRVDGTVDAVPAEIAQRGSETGDVVGNGHVELEHRRFRRQLAGRALGEVQAAPGAGEDDFRPLFLGDPRHRVRNRRVVEYAGDHNPLAVEQSHWPDVSY